jgi:hypothetical protein
MKQQQGQQGQQKINIDLSKTTSIVCETPECNGEIFMPAMKFRKISKLLTGSKEDGIIPVEVYLCTACGQIPKAFDFNLPDGK